MIPLLAIVTNLKIFWYCLGGEMSDSDERVDQTIELGNTVAKDGWINSTPEKVSRVQYTSVVVYRGHQGV
jgi:hypothetical protein